MSLLLAAQSLDPRLLLEENLELDQERGAKSSMKFKTWTSLVPSQGSSARGLSRGIGRGSSRSSKLVSQIVLETAPGPRYGARMTWVSFSPLSYKPLLLKRWAGCFNRSAGSYSFI